MTGIGNGGIVAGDGWRERWKAAVAKARTNANTRTAARLLGGEARPFIRIGDLVATACRNRRRRTGSRIVQAVVSTHIGIRVSNRPNFSITLALQFQRLPPI